MVFTETFHMVLKDAIIVLSIFLCAGSYLFQFTTYVHVSSQWVSSYVTICIPVHLWQRYHFNMDEVPDAEIRAMCDAVMVVSYVLY